jgi:hypothetical protein
MMPDGPKPIAAVITEWRANSHADVILSRLLDPEAWGHARPFGLKLASVYADQFPPDDLCRAMCKKHGVPIFPTVTGAVGVGTREVPVEGVLLIGEHGDYPTNAKGQKLYPRFRLFEEVVHAFRVLGRRVPVFCDKHLSYEWLLARWMYDLARHEGFPLMAGSSLPVTWRVPEYDPPIGAEFDELFTLGYGGLEAYGFHALETLQCIAERRRGGEAGVSSVRCVSGAAVWDGLATGVWSRVLLDAMRPAILTVLPSAPEVKPAPSDALFLIEYRNGPKAAVAMLASAGPVFALLARRSGVERPEATVFDLQPTNPFGHFGYLLRAIEHLILTGHPPYPVERTLLTTGMLSALLQSRAEGSTTIRTPHLEAIRYAPTDWPHAPGPRYTAA